MLRRFTPHPLRLILQLALLATLAVSVVRMVPFVRDQVALVPGRWERAGQGTPAERERGILETNAPGLFRAASLVETLCDGPGHLEIPLAVLGPDRDETWIATAMVVLGYHLAPAGRIVPLFEDAFRAGLEGTGPGAPDPALLGSLGGAVVILACHQTPAEADALVALARRQFGGAPVLTRGRSVDDVHHLLLVGDLPQRIASGDPAYARYRCLLP